MLASLGPSLHPSASAALAWADRLYHAVAPLPEDVPEIAIPTALRAYQRVERRYGVSPRTRKGIGDCLMLMGRYGEASRTYRKGRWTAQAQSRADLAQWCKSVSGGRTVQQIEPVLGSRGRWIVLFTENKPLLWPQRQPWYGLRLREVRRFRGVPRFIGGEIALPDGDAKFGGSLHGALYTMRANRRSDPQVLLYQGYSAADCSPSTQSFYRVRADGIHFVHRFRSVGDVRIVPADLSHGVRILVQRTYKVWWTDVYEWDGTRFAFDNRRSPELCPSVPWSLADHDGRDYYPGWLKYAAWLMIHGRRLAATVAYREAERRCAYFERHGQTMGGWNSDPEYIGTRRVVLKEIRQRLRWLQRGDYSHALLYRPYDFDIQVPPYKLGTALDALGAER